LRGRETASDPANIVRSTIRHFDPIIDDITWAKVQAKLGKREVKANPAGRNPKMYLAGLVICKGCGKPMQARADREEYYCATWDRARHAGVEELAKCPCERNGVKQKVLAERIERYLAEAGKRLDILLQPPAGDDLTAKLAEQEASVWMSFRKGIVQLTDYL